MHKASPRFCRTWRDNDARTDLWQDVVRLFPGLDHDRFRQFLRLLGVPFACL